MQEKKDLASDLEKELSRLRIEYAKEKDKGKKALLSLQAQVLKDNTELYFNIKDSNKSEYKKDSLEQKVFDFINYNDEFLKKSGITD